MTLADGSGLVLCAISSAQRAASMKRSSSRSASAVSPVVLSRDRTNESFRGLSGLHESRLGFLAAGFDMHRAAQLMAGDVPCRASTATNSEWRRRAQYWYSSRYWRIGLQFILMDFLVVFVDAANPLAVKVSSAAGSFHGITRYFHIFAFPAGNLSYGKHDKKALGIMSEGRRSNVKMSAAEPARTRALSYAASSPNLQRESGQSKTCACSNSSRRRARQWLRNGRIIRATAGYD